MGATGDRKSHDHFVGGEFWFELSYAGADPASHHGTVLGRRWGPDAGDAAKLAEGRATSRRVRQLCEAADLDTEANGTVNLDALFGTWTVAPSTGPWPGVSPASWWFSRTSSERVLFRSQIVAMELGVRWSS
jgi:hypothetical protein